MDWLRNSSRWIALTLVLGFASVLVVAPVAGAHTLSKGAAVRKAGAVARSVAIREGAPYYLAGGCTRLSRHAFRCIGAVLASQDYGCAQRIRVAFASSSSRRLVATRYGRVVCGDPSEDESVGGGGSSPAICAIRQSVCI